MYNPTVIGVDPGIVHTGVVMLAFDLDERELIVDHRVVDGPNAMQTRNEIEAMTWPRPYSTLDIFVEKYRPRSAFSVDQAMMTANTTFKDIVRGKLLLNSGVKKVVTPELLKLLHVWKFSTTTHHQDLRSAARIGVLGMLQDDTLNKVLFTYCTDTIDGRNWNVQVL